ncbi:cytidyltransferase-related enzyme [Burkholderiales bacterium JOSHI_001]|nr:cytidyltransferase-related enzyme [Burkholderiales bacterium JOSHI_001]
MTDSDRRAALVVTGRTPPLAHPRPGGPLGTAITYGTYDLFHVGHVRLFQRIKARCDFLVVAVSTDEFNAIKGKKSVMPFADRLELVRSCRYVDLAIAENGWEQKESDIAAYGVDAFYMGDDWSGRFDHLKTLCDVHYLPRTDGVSSTLLKQDVVVASAQPPG